ncbi:MAG TPA: UbiA family prenyltransferase [Thermoanaerobaculia bacterium]|nr:UbiA family prenyltransferase [Thermoanaerobaculia bacterium]
MATTAFWLKVSRPGLWFQTLWLYLLPTSQHAEVFRSPHFWLGLLFVTYPLNLLVYGLNDVADQEIDRHNPRKDSFLFGARGSAEELRRVPTVAAAVNLPFAIALTAAAGPRMALLLAAVLAVNVLYDLPRWGLRGRPPLELLNQLGYLLVLPLSSLLNGLPLVSGRTLLYLALFCTHAHLVGEIMDIEPDRRAGRRTTATVLGARPTKLVVLALVLAEGWLLIVAFRDPVLGSFLLLGALWLLLDATLLHRARPYTRREFRVLGLALNVAGFASIAWAWAAGTL